MRICIVTPAPARSLKGNRITAVRWARILRTLGHRVAVTQRYEGQPCDLVVALHARRSAPSVRRFRRQRPRAPLVLALTGTDLYHDIHRSRPARRSCELASRLVVLQPDGIGQLPEPLRPLARVIFQSVARPRRRAEPLKTLFEVCVLGHLRPVKDPFRTAQAARLLRPASRIRVVHIGGALSRRMALGARRETAANPRYRWLGELPRWRAMRLLARSRLLVVTSQMEGGANVISEALAASVPVLSSHIGGSIGILGEDYPGYFPAGDTRALAALLERAEADARFYRALAAGCKRVAPLVEPGRERQSWQRLLGELADETT